MSYKIDEVEGIGEVFREKLAAAKITDTDKLLSECGNKAGRKAMSEATGINEAQLLKWCNRADLMRISGVGKQFAELMECCGVDTVKELATRRADNLTLKMNEVNAEKKLNKGAVSETQVQDWIEKAKGLEPMISH